MPDGEKKGITVRIDADLHAEVSAYLRENNMTMAEFVSMALDGELHPKNEMKGNSMANTRTIALQVSEELFMRIKEYLQRNSMTQKDFLIGLIEKELEREQTAFEGKNAPVSDKTALDEDGADIDEDAAVGELEANSGDGYGEDESEDEGMGFGMGM